jgi:hypothetical protein
MGRERQGRGKRENGVREKRWEGEIGEEERERQGRGE